MARPPATLKRPREIPRGRLRGILELARGIQREDESEEACKARIVSLGDFEGMPFIAKIGIEKGAAKGERRFLAGTRTASRQPSRRNARVGTRRRRARKTSSSERPEQPPITKPTWAS